MRPVSSRFGSVLTGSHQMVARVTLVDSSPQFGLHPTGTFLPIVAGDVTLSSLTDIKGTLSVTVPGQYWAQLQPFGTELYVERGVVYANGDTEYVGLGYYRIEQIDQADAPYGPIVVTGLDRIAQLQQNKLVFPLPIVNGMSHRSLFQQIINGVVDPGINPTVIGTGYPAYLYAHIPITWTGYDPDATTVVGDQIVEEDSYSFLSTLISYYNCVMKFSASGELTIPSIVIDSSVASSTIMGGNGGTLIKAKRVTKRTGVSNIVTAYGSDPTAITAFITLFNADTASPLAWNKQTYPQFGPSCTYYNSPLLQSDAQVELAGEVLLERYTGLPETFTLTVVPNPALEPNDVIDVVLRPGLAAQRCIIDTLTIPLTAGVAGEITTRIPMATEGYSLGLGAL